MSVLSLSYWESDVYWRQNNKHFAELAHKMAKKANVKKLRYCHPMYTTRNAQYLRLKDGRCWRDERPEILPNSIEFYRVPYPHHFTDHGEIWHTRVNLYVWYVLALPYYIQLDGCTVSHLRARNSQIWPHFQIQHFAVAPPSEAEKKVERAHTITNLSLPKAIKKSFY